MQGIVELMHAARRILGTYYLLACNMIYLKFENSVEMSAIALEGVFVNGAVF